MKTTKPISTISYNSEQFLIMKLNELINAQIIEFYAFVKHLGEDDEAGKKDHIHLYIEPAKLIQTVSLNDSLVELTDDITKPLRCLTFKLSKFDDWYMYGIHDRDYLRAKDLKKKFHYRFEDVKTSDLDDLRYKVKIIDLLDITPFESIREAVNRGDSFEEYLAKGKVPLKQIWQYEKAFKSLAYFREASVRKEIKVKGDLKYIRNESGYFDPVDPSEEAPF